MIEYGKYYQFVSLVVVKKGETAMTKSSTESKKKTESTSDQKSSKVRWNTSQLKSSYANVCNVSSTREEMILNFGVNQAWERGQPELEIELNNRVIISPYAAKRLSMMLNKVIKEYEDRYGDLNLDITQHSQSGQYADEVGKH